jgi:phosphotriesterase-related protein
MVAELCMRGYADKLVLSHDYICCEDKWNGKYPNDRRPGSVHDDLRGLCVVADVVLPRLKERGISEDQLRKITVDNPRRILAGKPKKGNRE